MAQQSSRSSTELLKQLHRLHIEWRIGLNLKLAFLTFKPLHSTHRSPAIPHRSITAPQAHEVHALICPSYVLSVPRHDLSFGSRAFGISAPKYGTLLPLHILQSQTLFIQTSFKDQLFSVSLSYPLEPRGPLPIRHDSLPKVWRYINHLPTYLLSI